MFRSHVLIKGQHHSDHSGLPEFLDAVAPSAVIVSGAPRPAAERPAEGWAARLAEQGISVFDQRRCGAVQLDLSSGRLALRAFLGGQSLTLNRAR